MDDPARRRLNAGASLATTPSGAGSTQRSSSSVSLAPPAIYAPDTFPNPVTRTQSACFPVTHTPSSKGLAMIRTTEPSPPPTSLTWEEAIVMLHKLEKKLSREVENDLRDLKLRMTSSKIELVSRKASRLYAIRQQLAFSRQLCRQEEEVMKDFSTVKALLEVEGKSKIDEDDYEKTKSDCLLLGGKLTDIRRRQRRLSGQVEELEGAIRELMDLAAAPEPEGPAFDMEVFKNEHPGLPEIPKLTQTLPSYDLFNSAPFSPSPRPGSAMSTDSHGERLGSASPAPPRMAEDYRSYRRGRDTTTDVSQDEQEDSVYLPQRKKKKTYGLNHSRTKTTSMSSDTDGEDCYEVFSNQKMSAEDAKKKAEEDRKKATEEEARFEREMEEQIKREEEEEAKRQEELGAKKKVDDEKKKAVLEAKQKAAAERAAELEAKRIAEADKKKAELDEKKKAEADKKKAALEAKQKAEDEAKKKKEELVAKKQAALDAKKKVEDEAKKKTDEEAKKKADEEAKKVAEAQRKIQEEEAQMKADQEEAKRKAEEERVRAVEEKRLKAEREAQVRAEEERQRKQEEEDRKMAEEKEARRKIQEQQIRMEEERRLDEEMRLEEERLKGKKPKSRSASRDRRREGAEGFKDDEDLLDAESLQPKPKSRSASRDGRKRVGAGEDEDMEAHKQMSAKSRSATRDKNQMLEAQLQQEEEMALAQGANTSRSATKDTKQRLEAQLQQEERDRTQSLEGLERTAYDRRQNLDTQQWGDGDADMEADGRHIKASGSAKSRSASRDRRQKQLELEQQRSLEEEEELLRQEAQQQAANLKGPKPKSRSASKDRKAAALSAQDDDDMLFDERHQIGKKEDLFAAISDTSLAAGKKSRARRNLSGNEFEETSTGNAQSNRGQEGEESSEHIYETLEEPKRAVKSRTASKERPRSRQNIGEGGVELLNEPAAQNKVKSRTASTERPMSGHLDPEDKQFAKSRTASRERRAGQAQEENIDHYTPDASEDLYAVAGQKGSKSRSHSRPHSGDFSDISAGLNEMDKNKSFSRERPASRASRHSDNYDEDQEEFEWEEGDDEDFELESMPSLAPASDPGQKSRTSSRERAGSGLGGGDHPGVLHRSRPTSQLDQVADETNRNRGGSRSTSRPGSGLEDPSSRLKSRTASKERPRVQPLSPEDEQMLEEAGYAEDAMTHRSSIRDLDEDQFLDARSAKSRTASRERASGNKSGSHEKLGVGEEENLRLTKSRTSSRERPGQMSSLLVDDARGSKSRTASRERPKSGQFEEAPMWPEETSDGEEVGKTRSRTASRERRQLVGGDRQDLLAEDVGYQTMPPQKVQGYRDEAELDAREYAYESGTMDSGVAESYHSACDEDLTGSEPMFNRQQRRDDMAVNPQYGRYDDAERQQQLNGYRNAADQFGAEENEQDPFLRSGKKVSFAEKDQQFNLKPDPDVKTIPGTNLFCFAPSSTHEMPYDTASGDVERSIQQAVEEQLMSATDSGTALPTGVDETTSSTSPKTFLKAMGKGIKGGGGHKPREASRERKGSILDNLFRRGRSGSAQNSINSSRQSSMDRASDTRPLGGAAVLQHSSAAGLVEQQPINRGSTRSDYSAGSVDNYDAEISESESDFSFFRRKKPRKVNTVDFDQLFARGHAMSERRENPDSHINHPDSGRHQAVMQDIAQIAGTPFEVYSKDAAFKKTQQEAGIGYAEKVQSYLVDQQHNQPQLMEYTNGITQAHAQMGDTSQGYSQIDGQLQLSMQNSATQPTSGRQPNIQQNVGPTLQQQQPGPAQQMQHPAAGGRKASRSPLPPGKSVQDSHNVSGNVSPTPRGKRQMTPQEFLCRIQDFVQKAEMDTEYSQPVWPAIVQSASDLPPTRPHGQSGLFASLDAPMPPPRSPRHSPMPESNKPLSYKQQLSPLGPPNHTQPSPFNQSQPSPFEVQAGQRRMPVMEPMARQKVQETLQQRPSSPYGANQMQRPVSPYQEQPSLQRQASPYHQEPRTVSPYQDQQRPVSPYQQQQHQQRIAPSPGKSYLDKPSLSPDPFGARIDMEPPPPGPPPPASTAAVTSSSIIANLRKNTIQPLQRESDIDDEITLDLRQNQERLDYRSMRSDYRNADRDIPPIPSPRRGRSPRRAVEQQQTVIAADRHIPERLRPDPLTAHELQPQQPERLRLAFPGPEDENLPTIQDTDLYKRLRAGLSNIDKLMSSETFKREMSASGADYQRYSHHLGRAEFGVLKKRNSFQGTSNPMTGGGNVLGSRDPSNERPASALARLGGTGRSRSNYSSHQPSRDSSLGRHDSRLSSNSNIPDLETQELGYGLRPSGSGSHTFGSTQVPHPHGSSSLLIQPHPEMVEKKREVLQEIADQKQAVKEAKVWVQLLLLFVLCLCVLVYLQSEG